MNFELKLRIVTTIIWTGDCYCTHLTYSPHVPLDWKTRTRTRIKFATIWTSVCLLYTNSSDTVFSCSLGLENANPHRNGGHNNLNRCLLWFTNASDMVSSCTMENANPNQKWEQFELLFVMLHELIDTVSSWDPLDLVIQIGKLQTVFIWREKPVLLALLSNQTIPLLASYPVFPTKWREISWVIFCGTDF